MAIDDEVVDEGPVDVSFVGTADVLVVVVVVVLVVVVVVVGGGPAAVHCCQTAGDAKSEGSGAVSMVKLRIVPMSGLARGGWNRSPGRCRPRVQTPPVML
jgi:hypothetical protein